MGYDPNNLIMTPSHPMVDKNFVAVKNELMKTGLVSAALQEPVPPLPLRNGASWSSGLGGKPSDASLIISAVGCGCGFSKTMGIKMLQGRDFSGSTVRFRCVILNKAAVEVMGLKNPLGQRTEV